MSFKELMNKYGFVEEVKGIFVLSIDSEDITEVYQIDSNSGYIRDEADFDITYISRCNLQEIERYIKDTRYFNGEDEFDD